MTLKRTVALGCAGGAVAVWLAAAATSNTRPPAPVRANAVTPVETRGADLAAEVARLRERLRPTATPLHTRDLFRYDRGRSAAARPQGPAALASPVPASPEIDPAPPPSLVLVGLAEDDGPGGPVRTAIISSGGDVFLAKEGDPVTARYRVTRISADVVELADDVAGTPLRLALK